MKKIIGFVLAIMIVFTFVACGQNNEPQDHELLEYKNSARTTLETYAKGKGQANYTVEEWNHISL